MSQQINLYNQALLPKLDVFSGRTVLLALGGIALLSLLIYVAMGWVGVIGASPLIDALGWNGFMWLAIGGLVYTVGIAFFVTDHKWRYGHGVWHLFVLGGSACHFGAVMLYVA